MDLGKRTSSAHTAGRCFMICFVAYVASVWEPYSLIAKHHGRSPFLQLMASMHPCYRKGEQDVVGGLGQCGTPSDWHSPLTDLLPSRASFLVLILVDGGEGPGSVLFFTGCNLVCSASELHAEATSSHLGVSGCPSHVLAVAILFWCGFLFQSLRCVIPNLFSVTAGAFAQRPAHLEVLHIALC